MTSEGTKTDLVALDFAGVNLTACSLTIIDPASFARVGRALESIDSFSQWWWGDYLLYAEKNDLHTVLDKPQKDLHRSTIYSYIETARFYAPADRDPSLSFGHHAAIQYILGQDGLISTAKSWLKRAAGNDWTIGELREAMRLEKRKGDRDPGPMRGVVMITDFMKISRWSATVKIQDFPATQIEEIRRTTEPLFDFLCQIHRRPFTPTR